MFKSGIADPVQGNKYMGIVFRFNAVQWHKEFKCIFVYQDLWKPTPTRKLSPNWKLYPFLKKILSIFHFVCLIGHYLSVDDQKIRFKGRHIDKIQIPYNNE